MSTCTKMTPPPKKKKKGSSFAFHRTVMTWYVCELFCLSDLCVDLAMVAPFQFNSLPCVVIHVTGDHDRDYVKPGSYRMWLGNPEWHESLMSSSWQCTVSNTNINMINKNLHDHLLFHNCGGGNSSLHFVSWYMYKCTLYPITTRTIYFHHIQHTISTWGGTILGGS